jgi:hypothetical protein
MAESTGYQSSVITSSYTIVKPRIFGAVLVPVAPLGPSRSIPAQVGLPIPFPRVVPALGKEHPIEGSITTDYGKPVRAVRNDPTLVK